MTTRLALPVVDRAALDNSILTTVGRCPRLAFYNYRLNRAATKKSYPILFGVAYHKFREVLELLYEKVIIENKQDLNDPEVQQSIFTLALSTATKDWEDPPLEDKKSYLDLGRLTKTCTEAFDIWLREKQNGYFKVIMTETAFDLPLPSGRRFTGRIDQIFEWNGRLYLRDYKTTSRMGKNYALKFEPSHQFTGYIWAAEQLAGREIEGARIEVVYNTKTAGPEFHSFLTTRSRGHIEAWLEWVEFEWENWARFSETETWPMRTNACDDFGGCYFRDCCKLSSWAMIEDWLENNTTISNWDPMNPEEETGLPE